MGRIWYSLGYVQLLWHVVFTITMLRADLPLWAQVIIFPLIIFTFVSILRTLHEAGWWPQR